MNFRSRFALLLCALAALGIPAFADSVLWPDASSSIAAIQIGGPNISAFGSGNLWVTPIQWTNSGTSTLDNVQFANTEAWACVGSCTGSGPDGTSPLTWNNALDEWQLLNSSGGVIATVQADNPAFSLSLSATSTNIPIPSGFGLSTADSVPAFSIGNLGVGASVTTDVDFLITANVNTFFFDGSEVATTPEPAVAALLALSLIPLSVLRCKRIEPR